MKHVILLIIVDFIAACSTDNDFSSRKSFVKNGEFIVITFINNIIRAEI